MKYSILILCAIFSLISCTNDDANQMLSEKGPSSVKHDPAPQNMHGEWASVSDKNEIIVTVSEGVVYFNLNRYNKGTFEISVKDFEAIASGKRLYTMKYAGMDIKLSTGTGEYAENLTLTIDNDCITRMIRYVAAIQPEPIEEPTPVFN